MSGAHPHRTPQPPDPPALIHARQLFQAGKLEEARTLVLKYLRLAPSHAEANNSLAVILMQLGQRDQALIHAQRAAAASPNTADYHATLGLIFNRLSRNDNAIESFQRAAQLEPHNPDHWLNLIPMLWDKGDHAGALHAAEQAHAADPRRALAPYASVLSNIGESDQAIALLRRALAAEPDAPDLLSALAVALNYSPESIPQEVFNLHRRFGELSERGVPRLNGTGSGPDPQRRLRIGIISPDLYTHSVSSFIEPILRHLDRAQFEVVCFSSRAFPDATTSRLKSFADQWHDIAGQPDEAVANQIAADRIDIVIELAGLTAGRFVGVMARRPAPVQVTAIGYPNTTGLSSIDWRLVDSITDPPDSLAIEKLHRLPGCFLCYTPPDAVRSLPPHPPQTTDSITFGSFNTAQKIVGPVIETWSKIINRVPGSRLVLKAAQFSCPMVRERFTNKFRNAGLSPDRFSLLPVIREKSSHLALYHSIDIALDPFPYNGTTTTCEALIMGVPVITLQGTMHPGRVGMSLLTAAGLSELIARTPEEYIALATNLAGDTNRLSHLHRTLSAQVLASPLCDGPAYSARFGAALRAMWLEHCRRIAPQ